MVTGGRNNYGRAAIYAVLDRIKKKYRITVLIHGGAGGADSIAKDWAREAGIPTECYNAKWGDLTVKGAVVKEGKYGKYNALAGLLRNQEMIDKGEPDACVAFDGGTGTADMVKRCKAAGLKMFYQTKPEK